MLRGVARHWVKTDDATLAKMAAVVKRLAVPEQGLTVKNWDRLRAFDDEEKVNCFLRLPQRLREDVDRGRLPPHRAAVLAGIAAAVELLIVAPVRRQNLADIDVERHLVRTGKKLHLVLPAAEVKNGTDLEFELPARTVEPIAAGTGRGGGLCSLQRNVRHSSRAGAAARRPKTPSPGRSNATVFEYPALKVNAHLFRHIGAKLYLDVMPGGYEVIRRVLGHKKMDTTVRFYTGFETKTAAKHFDKVILQRLETSQAAGTKAAFQRGTPVGQASSGTKPRRRTDSRPGRQP